MAGWNQTSKLINGLLRFVAVGGVTTAAIVAPNSIQLFEKPLQNYLKKLDEKDREKELLRLVRYSRSKGLISDNYQHGLQITDIAKKRLKSFELTDLQITRPITWDGHWRIVFYDIPEHKKSGRDALSSKLRQLGFYQLQRSVWIHPFPCQEEISEVALAYGVASYITLLEAASIQNKKRLEAIFCDVL